MIERMKMHETPLTPALAENDNPRLFAAVSIFFTVLLLAILFVPDYLPMIDLPQHAAQIAMWKQFDEGTLPNMGNYTINLFTPYLGGYAIARLLSCIMPVMFAIKTTVFLALMLPLTALYLEVRKHPFLRWSVFLFIPFLFNWSFYWGFLNFLFAIGPTLFFLFLSVRLINRQARMTYYAICGCTLLLFFCHILSALIYVGLTGAYVLIKTKSPRQVVFALLSFLPFIALSLGWFLCRTPPAQNGPVAAGRSPTFWLLGFQRVLDLPITMLSGPYYGEHIAVLVLIATVLLLLGALFYGGIRKERLLLLLIVALAYALLPQYVFGCAYVYQRYAFLLVPLAIYAVGDTLARNRTFCRILQVLCIVVPTVYLSMISGVFTAFNEEVSQFTALKKHMEKNKRVLSMMFDNRAGSVAGPVMLHFPLWYQATHGGYVDFNFNSPVKYTPDSSFQRVPSGFVWHPETFPSRTFETYDYYILKLPFHFDRFPFAEFEDAFELLYREGDWHLFAPRSDMASNLTALSR